MAGNVEQLSYLISHTDDKYTAKVKATQWTGWKFNLKATDFLAYVRMRWGDCRVIGDNAYGYGTPEWNPNEFHEYITKYLPGDEPSILEYDEKKNLVFKKGRQVYTFKTKTDSQESTDPKTYDNLSIQDFFKTEEDSETANPQTNQSKRGRKRNLVADNEI